jgi:hypothetical protein
MPSAGILLNDSIFFTSSSFLQALFGGLCKIVNRFFNHNFCLFVHGNAHFSQKIYYKFEFFGAVSSAFYLFGGANAGRDEIYGEVIFVNFSQIYQRLLPKQLVKISVC